MQGETTVLNLGAGSGVLTWRTIMTDKFLTKLFEEEGAASDADKSQVGFPTAPIDDEDDVEGKGVEVDATAAVAQLLDPSGGDAKVGVVGNPERVSPTNVPADKDSDSTMPTRNVTPAAATPAVKVSDTVGEVLYHSILAVEDGTSAVVAAKNLLASVSNL